MNREEFEKWYQEQYAGYGYNEALATFERQQKIIDELREENPDVPCPVCKGEKKIIMGRNITDTGWCYDNCCYCNGNGTVSTVKALQYEIEQLKGEVKNEKM